MPVCGPPKQALGVLTGLVGKPAGAEDWAVPSGETSGYAVAPVGGSGIGYTVPRPFQPAIRRQSFMLPSKTLRSGPVPRGLRFALGMYFSPNIKVLVVPSRMVPKVTCPCQLVQICTFCPAYGDPAGAVPVLITWLRATTMAPCALLCVALPPMFPWQLA